MALRPYPGFVGPSYTSESRIAAYDRTVNLYAERIESGTGTATYVLYPTPGYLAGSNIVPTSPGRCIFTLNGVIYVVYGSGLYQVGDGIIVLAQGLSDLSGDVAQIIGNGDAGHQLLIRADTTLYAFDLNASDVPETLDPPTIAPYTLGSVGGGGSVPQGWHGYAYTYVTATGETTASPVATILTGPIGAFNGTVLVNGARNGPDVVTSRNIYRTDVQATEALALTAQLKLVGTIAGNTWPANGQFVDTFADASLGANVPVVNTATITVVDLTTIPAITSNMIGYLNSYGLSLNADLSQVNFSEPLDFTDWPALNVFQRSDAADRWLALLVNVKEVWLFGRDTTSVYYNDADDPDEPFKPNPNVLIQMGIIAPNSACMVDGQPMWIGQGKDGAGVVYRANGYTPVRVSTHAVEYAFSQLPVDGITPILQRAEGSTYQQNGHVFYELTFPSIPDGGASGATWVFDATEGLWSERGQHSALVFYELDTRGHAQVNTAQYTTSRTSGLFYTQSLDYQTFNGDPIVRLRRAPHINQAQQRIRYSHLRLMMETGLGLGGVPETTVGFDPQITLSWSDDGGQTFGASYPVSAGKLGEFSTLVEWRQLGQARDRIFEFTCSAPVPWRLVNAFIDYSIGPS